MKRFTCTVCPRGCLLTVEADERGSLLSVSGNACPRGEVYAENEMVHPQRVLTATCPLDTGDAVLPLTFPRRVPVKTTTPMPRQLLRELAAELLVMPVALPVRASQVIIADWRGLGITVIATRDIDLSNRIPI